MHYKDGTEAKLGDHVRGKTYNYPREISGTVVGLKGGESCNLIVAFVAPVIPPEARGRGGCTVPFAQVAPGYDPVKGWAGDESGSWPVAVFSDYGTVGEFELAERDVAESVLDSIDRKLEKIELNLVEAGRDPSNPDPNHTGMLNPLEFESLKLAQEALSELRASRRK